MPCDSGPSNDEVYKERLDRVTRLLGTVVDATRRREEDERIKKEELRQSALAKLTLKERRALGLS